jgi:HK97 family phage portal protein
MLRGMMHPRSGGSSWLLLNRTNINYASQVKPDANSIIIACVRWVQRVYSEAPLMLQRWLMDRAEWEDIHRDPVLDLLDRPNRYYGGTTLWKATVADLMLTGNAYWLKVRGMSGRVVELWWAPSTLIEPRANDQDTSVFISHYEYSPNGRIINLRVEDVVHFRDGMDPANPRKGLSPIKGLFREIFTDDEASNMTASLLRNMGVPGVIISPQQGIVSQAAAERIKASYLEKFSGDRKGEPLVMEGATKIEQFGFSPEQMQLRELRGIPEERITAVLGVNAAVVGLGAGLASTKVGATLREYREEAFESTIIPMYRETAAELTHQLLDDFVDVQEFRLVHDLRAIRVLQEDEMVRTQRMTTLVNQGLLTIAEGRRALGWPVKPEHELYLRPANVTQIPTGPLRIQEGRPLEQDRVEPQAALARNGHQG